MAAKSLLSVCAQEAINARETSSCSFGSDRLTTLIALPLLAVLFGLLVMACFKLTHSHLLPATGALWIGYGIYEYLMQIRVLCSGECNIRVDLLLIYPVLLALTLASLVRVTMALWRRRRGLD